MTKNAMKESLDTNVESIIVLAQIVPPKAIRIFAGTLYATYPPMGIMHVWNRTIDGKRSCTFSFPTLK